MAWIVVTNATVYAGIDSNWTVDGIEEEDQQYTYSVWKWVQSGSPPTYTRVIEERTGTRTVNRIRKHIGGLTLDSAVAIKAVALNLYASGDVSISRQNDAGAYRVDVNGLSYSSWSTS